MSQIIGPTYFFAIQATYTGVEVGLCHGDSCASFITIPTHQASKELIPTLSALLSQRQITLQELAFCIASQGPAPFTTLRTVIATIQGLTFATGIPVVAVNGLEAFACVAYASSENYTHTFVLLHAFGQDVYWAQADHAQATVEAGCMSFEAWLIMCTEFLKQHPTARVRFVGNGFRKHQQRLMQVFDHPLVAETVVEYLPFEQLVAMGIAQWEQQKGIVQDLTPLYLKSYVTPSV